MDDKLKFQEALVSLQSRAEEQGGVLTIEEMQDCLKNMNFNQEQLGMISAYLTGKGIHVEGAELPEEEQKPYTEEEEEFLGPVQKRIKICPPPAGRSTGDIMAAGKAGRESGKRTAG